ncbi:thermonuclease family protein [Lederbergia citrea]|uniref:thermonuclease family protein n=1 Tax=Lederbergia citrea TaxID=2833581 RepID=UPI002016281A|nr:thermonuclease family protein [Lederbergia citrea]
MELFLGFLVFASLVACGVFFSKVIKKAKKGISLKRSVQSLGVSFVVLLGSVAVFGNPELLNLIQTSGTTDQIPVKLVKTIDGDTIKIRYQGKDQNVRYLLIDTPETNHPRLGKQPFGEEAKERNNQLVKSGKLTIEFDVGERVDKYGRLLAYVYVDGKSVQQTLLEEGLARVAYVYPPNTRHLTPYEEAQQRAKIKGIGIWSIENYATDTGFKENDAKNSGSSDEVKEYFKNCTELRKKYPNGVPKGHPAYQAKMDGDKDGYACER